VHSFSSGHSSNVQVRFLTLLKNSVGVHITVLSRLANAKLQRILLSPALRGSFSRDWSAAFLAALSNTHRVGLRIAGSAWHGEKVDAT
jgi:hypothetical protein